MIVKLIYKMSNKTFLYFEFSLLLIDNQKTLVAFVVKV